MACHKFNFSWCFTVYINTGVCVFQGVKLTPFEEEQLKKKWQEILGPSNEIIVSF